MTRRRAAAAAALPIAALVALSGCALLEPQTSQDPPTALEQCALGHQWRLDTQDVAAQVLALLTADGNAVTEVTASGTQTLDWTEQSHATLEVDFTVTAVLPPPAEGQERLVTGHYDGVATGRAYINGPVAIPRNWDDGDLDSRITATLDGVEEEVLPFRLPQTVINDTVGLQLTCEGSTLTIQQRGHDIVLRWARVS